MEHKEVTKTKLKRGRRSIVCSRERQEKKKKRMCKARCKEAIIINNNSINYLNLILYYLNYNLKIFI
jgi:hypothetical protein